MAYSMMTAAELLALKAAIKKEMLRRNAPIGGLDAYGGAAYDFSATPVSGGVVKADIGMFEEAKGEIAQQYVDDVPGAQRWELDYKSCVLTIAVDDTAGVARG